DSRNAGRGLVVVAPGGLFDDLLRAGTPDLFERGEGLAWSGEITQALGELYSVLDGQRGSLPGGGRRRVRGVTDDDHPVGVPGGQAGHGVHRAGGQVMGSGLDEPGGW